MRLLLDVLLVSYLGWKVFAGPTVLLMHGAKTGGSSSKVFMRWCTHFAPRDNFLNWDKFSWNISHGLLGSFPQGVYASHIYTEERAYQVFSNLPKDVLVAIPVRRWHSWLVSAVKMVAVRSPNVPRSHRFPCILDNSTLEDMLQAPTFELTRTQENLFAGLARASASKVLEYEVTFLDFEKLDSLYARLVERGLCAPSYRLWRPMANLAAHKREVYFQRERHGVCQLLGPMVHRHAFAFAHHLAPTRSVDK